jgi:hypothetical protein
MEECVVHRESDLPHGTLDRVRDRLQTDDRTIWSALDLLEVPREFHWGGARAIRAVNGTLSTRARSLVTPIGRWPFFPIAPAS